MQAADWPGMCRPAEHFDRMWCDGQRPIGLNSAGIFKCHSHRPQIFGYSITVVHGRIRKLNPAPTVKQKKNGIPVSYAKHCK